MDDYTEKKLSELRDELRKAKSKRLLRVLLWGITGAVVFLGLVILTFWAWPKYRVYSQQKAGEAALKKAEFERRTMVETARAEKDSAVFKAEAEIERAKGVAEANRIIGASLKDNDAYLRYLWVQGLNDGSTETIYIPTEANLPILEATRRREEPTSIK
jgi:hypothetical protein